MSEANCDCGKIYSEILPALDDFSAGANVLIKNGLERSGQEIHESVGFIKSRFPHMYPVIQPHNER